MYILFRQDAIPPMGKKNTGGKACDFLSAVDRFVKEKSLKTGRCPNAAGRCKSLRDADLAGIPMPRSVEPGYPFIMPSDGKNGLDM
jgi:hypothetical protein